MNRTATLLRGLDRSMRIIEIGPSFAPLAPKRDGWSVVTVDHASREELIAKYAEHPSTDVSQIEEVDYVWQGGAISDLIPQSQHGTFDAFIASHVIEHTTDLVSFLRSARELLKPDGMIVLAVPDKRKCFDLYRPVSTTGSAIAAYRERRSRHTPQIIFDYAAFHSLKTDAPGWSLYDRTPQKLVVPFDHLLGRWEDAERETSYVDAHQWVFTPSSFWLLVLELSQLGLLDVRIDAIEETALTEFYAWLRVGSAQFAADDLQLERRRLMDAISTELAEQTRLLDDSPLTVATDKLAATESLAEARRTELESVARVAEERAQALAVSEQGRREAEQTLRATEQERADAMLRIYGLEQDIRRLRRVPKWIRKIFMR